MLRWILTPVLIAGFYPHACLESKGQKSDSVQCGPVRTCGSPKYTIVRRTPTVKSGPVVNVVIDKKRFNPHDLIALACALKKDFVDSPSILVQIFDNKRSAKRYVPRWAQEKPAGWEQDEEALRAYFIKKEGRETISWYRDSLHKKGETTVDLCVSLHEE